MYCVNCGVELRKGADKCPLCGLKVYHPDIKEDKEEAPYPPFTTPEKTKRPLTVMFVLTLLIMIPIFVCIYVDIMISGKIVWSGYAAGGIVLWYMFSTFPFWFKKRNPVVLFPATGITAILYLLYISVKTGGGWFLSFAFPISGCVLLLIESAIVLLRYASKGQPHRIAVILGSECIAVGGLCVLIEFMLHVSFGTTMTWWSGIPLTVQTMLGIIIIIISAKRSLRESFYKRFFI